MKILIAPDSFKDSLSARKVAESLQKGILDSFAEAKITLLPLADGGEGTLEAINNNLEIVKTPASDALFRQINSEYLFDKKTNTAYIEMAQTAGLEKIKPGHRNPLKTTTFGVGQQIEHAVLRNAENIVLFVGGSATNDAGIGMAAALGFVFFDDESNTLNAIGENLIKIKKYEYKGNHDLSKINFIVATDVINQFYGKTGAAHIYAAQKGANYNQIIELDKGLRSMAELIKSNNKIDLQEILGSGAAGGLGGGAVAFLNAKVVSAADLIFNITNLTDKVRDCDIIITGEGRIDDQTWNGKFISRILDISMNKKIILVAGKIDANINSIPNILMSSEIKTTEITLDYSKKHAAELLIEKGKEIGNFLKSMKL